MANVIWTEPRALFALWLLLPLGWLLVSAQRRRRRAAAAFADERMAPRLMPLARGARTWWRGVLLLLGVAALVFAVARPRWGLYFDTVTRRGADIMVLLDVSRSMLSTDVRPNRLERSKSDVYDLLRRVGGDRVGLVVFAGRAVVACPLTTDHGFLKSVLQHVGPDSAPRGGTAIGDAIRRALDAFDPAEDRDRALLLITDGEDHDSFPAEAAAAAAERKVKIFAVGMGDPVEGARVPVVDDAGNRVYLRHEGKEIWSRMDESLLRGISLQTGGAYVPARTSNYDLGAVYEEHLAQLAAGEISEDKRERYHERFQVFLALGFFCLLLRQSVRPYARGLAVLALCALPALAGEEAGTALQHYRAGEYEQAARIYEALAKAEPDNPRIAFNRGVALQRLGGPDRLDAARVCYLDAARSGDRALSARAHFNLGTLEADRAKGIFGEQPEQADAETRKKGVGSLDAALRHFRATLDREPGHSAARRNIERIRLWLKRMRAAWKQRDEQEPPEQEKSQLLEALKKVRDGQRALMVEEQAAGEAQEALRGELAGLGEIIRKELAAQGQEKVRDGMLQGIEQVDRIMAGAVEALGAGDSARARQGQAASYGLLDQMWSLIAPFDRILKEAIGVQEAVLEVTREGRDLEWAVEDELRVGGYARLLGLKAKAGLEQGGASGPAGQQLPVEAYTKAIGNAPRIIDLANRAAADLGAERIEEALPREEEALRLLKEIEELLPRQDQQQNDQDDDQQQDKQDKDQEQQQQQQQQQQDKQDQGKQEGEQQSPSSQSMTPEEIEALLRKAEERERKHREEKEQRVRAYAARGKVERDW